MEDEELQRSSQARWAVPTKRERQFVLLFTDPAAPTLDATGRLVRQGPAPGSAACTIDLQQVGGGAYVLRLATGDRKRTMRFVK